MPYIDVDEGVSIYVEDIGSESGAKDVLQPVLFIHGWPLSHEMFEYQFMALHKSGYRSASVLILEVLGAQISLGPATTMMYLRMI